MLGDEHGMPPVGSLPAVISGFGIRQPLPDQLLGVAADREQAAEVHERPVTAAEVETGPERLPCERIQAIVDRGPGSIRPAHPTKVALQFAPPWAAATPDKSPLKS